jgi:hypothetical protein
VNLQRRHLNEGQRASVAARLVTITGKGRPSKNAPIGAFSQPDAADRMNVSRRLAMPDTLMLAEQSQGGHIVQTHIQSWTRLEA